MDAEHLADKSEKVPTPGPRPGTSTNPAGARDHYIPVGYLKQWAGPDRRLCEFSRPYCLKPGIAAPAYIPVKPRMTYPKGIGYVRGLNTFPTLPPEISSALEGRFLLQVDNQSITILRKLAHGDGDLTIDERSRWSQFIMALMYRNPEAITRLTENFGSEYSTYLEQYLAEMPEELRKHTTPETIELLRQGLSRKTLEQLVFHSLHMMMDNERIGNALNRMHLSIFEFDNSHDPLLTSDRPIVMTNGLNKSDSHIAIPISPRRIVIMANNIGTLKTIEETAQSVNIAQLVNDHVIRKARQYVYGTDDRALAFVEERLGERAAWSPFE
jgi:hypothetical protein